MKITNEPYLAIQPIRKGTIMSTTVNPILSITSMFEDPETGVITNPRVNRVSESERGNSVFFNTDDQSVIKDNVKAVNALLATKGLILACSHDKGQPLDIIESDTYGVSYRTYVMSLGTLMS